jgi:orotate phosphoribosyltransferase
LGNGDIASSNLWIAEELWNLGAIEFGDYTLGRTAVHSPIYINVRRLISNPLALDRCAALMHLEIEALLAMRNPHVRPFGLVAGVPFGGLHLSTAYSLRTTMPMIYIHPPGPDREATIEGIYRPGQSCLIIDDLVTGGGSILQTAQLLRDSGMFVYDAVALVDRMEGGRKAVREGGINLTSILTLEQIANYLYSSEKIDRDQHSRVMTYVLAARG